MNNLIFAMMAFAFTGAVTPGPVNILATSTAINYGRWAATRHVLGASLSYALVVLCCGIMMQSLLTLLPVLTSLTRIVGTLFLLNLARQLWFAPLSVISISASAHSGWWTGALTQLLNPKAWLFATSGISLYVAGQENQLLTLSLFTAVSLVVCALGVGVWALLGTFLAGYLQQPDRQRRFNKLMAALLAGAVLIIWL